MDEQVETEETWKRLIAKGVARGLFVWGSYIVVGVLVSWVAFLFVAGDVWRTMPAFPGARVGPIALIFLLLFPQTWVSLFYLLGLPALYFFAGQKMALVVAVSRVARGRSRRLVHWLGQACFPACEVLAQVPGATTVRAASRRLLQTVEQPREGNAGKASRWLARRLTASLKVAEICATAAFLEQLRNDPRRARFALEDMLDTRLQELARGRRFAYLWILIGITLAITALRHRWVPLLAR